jgi:hypothetical protein
MPGRIVILRDPEMDGHEATINQDEVEQNVHLAVQTLTGIDDTGLAFESLFPGLVSTSTIVLKVNCIGPCDTRWETARGVVSGLSMMLGGTYDVSQVVIFDNHNLPDHGYTNERFTFNGNYPLISSTCNPSTYWVWGRRMSQYLLDADYLINIPVLKSHSNGNNQITLSLKNHYGSMYPPTLCGNIIGMLNVNLDTNIKDKTCLVLMDALRATYNGEPIVQPQTWQTYAEGTPNTLLATTDPVTNEYWGRDMINAERDSRGWPLKPCPWVEEAAGDPYYLGTCDPESMTVIHLDPYLDVEPGRPGVAVGTTFLAGNVPNPFSHSTTLRFRLANAGSAVLKIYNASGRRVRTLGGREYPAGYSEVRWNGQDSNGAGVAPGVYFVRLEASGRVHTRRVVVVR